MNERLAASFDRYLNVLILIALAVLMAIEFQDDPTFYRRIGYWVYAVAACGIAVTTIYRFAKSNSSSEEPGSKQNSDS
jgi:xanthine/uracil permease